MRVTFVKWTHAHFSLKISLEGLGQCFVSWANLVQPKGANTGQFFKPSGLGFAFKQDQHDQQAKTQQPNPVF